MKIARDINKIYPKAVYCWSYHTTHSYRYWKAKTEKSLYKKKYCQVPYYSRVQAKHILVETYGVEALNHVHFISGRKLRKELGRKTFPYQKYPTDVLFGERGVRMEIYVKKRNQYEVHYVHWGSMPKYIIPPEYKYDKHRRRHFTISLYLKRKQGISVFNKWYKSQFYGYRQGISKMALRSKRKEVNDALLQEIPSLRPNLWRSRTGDI